MSNNSDYTESPKGQAALEQAERDYYETESGGTMTDPAGALPPPTPFEAESSDMFEDDPEGAADEEMSCWDE